jgi:putative DNA primase/helicase
VRTGEILERLEGVERRNGYWMALCPAHNDHNPSLSIKEGDDGKPLLYCHAGCSFEQVMAELREEPPARTQVRSANGKPTKVWRVRNHSGELKGLHLRFDRPGGDKECLWKRPSGEWGLNGTPLSAMPLYRSEHARDWPEDVPVIVVEGEKAADALAEIYPATLGTVTGAGKTPGPEPLEVLRDKQVILWADNDEEGRTHMRRVAEALQGVAAEVRILEWNEAPPKGDAADHPVVLHRSKKEFGELLDAMASAPI